MSSDTIVRVCLAAVLVFLAIGSYGLFHIGAMVSAAWIAPAFVAGAVAMFWLIFGS